MSLSKELKSHGFKDIKEFMVITQTKRTWLYEIHCTKHDTTWKALLLGAIEMKRLT